MSRNSYLDLVTMMMISVTADRASTKTLWNDIGLGTSPRVTLSSKFKVLRSCVKYWEVGLLAQQAFAVFVFTSLQ